ncbi:Haloacid dehalogenase-like hydrolase domain-containing protein 2 [Jimgerdemannia flammicorona]|uniref:Haloacid dehalogenase-like hydrolase domain-containing protein 2 n=1 Tax=Jimgerdemannia flammicorona TaxID=994334 RepID=A0A433QTT3_9FUNG|nr:Haloacid dehalogenase-like hydrolase domain-containing protein 2 [Jimgerdemannia flammicorona]
MNVLTKSLCSSRFASNNTKESSARLINKLSNLGFDVQRHELMYLHPNLSVAPDLHLTFSVPRSGRFEGAQVRRQRRPSPLLLLEDIAREEFDGIPTGEPNNAVVIGLSPTSFRYELVGLNKAFHLILNGAPLIAAHKAQFCTEKEGEVILGPGAFITGLEYATGTTATIVGKPSRSFYELALKDIGCLDCPQEVVMIARKPSVSRVLICPRLQTGDNIRTDFGHGAHELGLIRYLVKTGYYRDGDESKSDENGVHGVDGIFDNFGSVVNHIVGGGSSA